MNKKDVDKSIDNLLDSFGEQLDDHEFIEACDEMISRAEIARDARQDELGEDD